MTYRLFIVIVFAGLALGLSSANWMIEARPFSTVTESGWRTVPTLGDFEATPYVKAYRAKHALMATTGRDTLIFRAVRDSAGERLNSACTYSINGRVTTAGWWTLHAQPMEDSLASAAHASLVNSLNTVQSATGEIDVMASAQPRPGNWLPVPPGRYALVLSLYDAPFARDALNGRLTMPAIDKVGC